VLASGDDIREAQEALKRPDLSEGARQHQQLLVNATEHPASGEPMSAVVRVASIAPVNIPLIFLMLKCPSSNVPGTPVLHWVNQSYNALTNYCHRSGKDVGKACVICDFPPPWHPCTPVPACARFCFLLCHSMHKQQQQQQI